MMRHAWCRSALVRGREEIEISRGRARPAADASLMDGWMDRGIARESGARARAAQTMHSLVLLLLLLNNHRVPNSAKRRGVIMPLLLSARRAYDPARPSESFSRLNP